MWWFFYGLISGAFIMRLVMLAQNGLLTINWYLWPMIAAVVIGLGLTAQHFFASFKELCLASCFLFSCNGTPTPIKRITTALLHTFKLSPCYLCLLRSGIPINNFSQQELRAIRIT